MAVAVSIFVALVTACVRVGPPSAELAAYETGNNHSLSGFLKPWSYCYFGLETFCWRAFLGFAGCLATSLTSSHYPPTTRYQGDLSGCDNQKGLQTLPNDLREAKEPLVENYCSTYVKT